MEPDELHQLDFDSYYCVLLRARLRGKCHKGVVDLRVIQQASQCVHPIEMNDKLQAADKHFELGNDLFHRSLFLGVPVIQGLVDKVQDASHGATGEQVVVKVGVKVSVG